VSFSQNGYSEELFKVGQLSRTVFNSKLNDESTQEIQPPPGFVSVRIIEGSDLVLSCSKPLGVDDSIPDNGGDHNSQNTITAPPGFEAIHTTQICPQKRVEPKRKRVVLRHASLKNKKASLKSDSLSTNKTSESLVKLPHEALK